MSILTVSVLGITAVLLAVQLKGKGSEYGTYIVMAAGLCLFFYAAGGQPDTGNRTGRCGSVAGTSWKQRPDPEYGGHRGSACAGGGVASAAFETFNPLSGVPGKRGAFAAGQ